MSRAGATRWLTAALARGAILALDPGPTGEIKTEREEGRNDQGQIEHFPKRHGGARHVQKDSRRVSGARLGVRRQII